MPLHAFGEYFTYIVLLVGPSESDCKFNHVNVSFYDDVKIVFAKMARIFLK
jgi:hypothetical protein